MNKTNTLEDLINYTKTLQSKSNKKVVIESVQNFIKSNPLVDSIAWSQNDEDMEYVVTELYLKTNKQILSKEGNDAVNSFFKDLTVEIPNSWEDDEFVALDRSRKISSDEKKFLKDFKKLESDLQKIGLVMLASFGNNVRVVVKHNSYKEYDCTD